MVTFTTSASPAVLIPPEIQVFLGGNFRRDALVSTISDVSGSEPASATILFPTRGYLEHPVRDNASVVIKVNPQNRSQPLFRGYVTGFGDVIDTSAGEFVEVFCLDDVWLMGTGFVDRNYNIVDSRGAFTEQLTIREIVDEIRSQLVAFLGTSAAPDLMTASFPNDFPGTMELLSQPYSSAIEQLLSGTEFKIRRQYTSTRTLIYAYKIGVGPSRNVIIGTDINSGPQVQPFGVTNVGAVRSEEIFNDIVNAGVMIGERVTKETALSLTRAWPAAKNDMLVNIEVFTRPGTNEDPNPDFDAEAERIGRAWRYGKVNTGRFTEFPELEPRLLVAGPFGHTNNADDLLKPFVAFQFSGEATINVTFDFNVTDNEIFTSKPLTKDNFSAGGSSNFEIASAAWIETAFKLRTPLSVEVGKQGGAGRKVSRAFQRGEFKKKFQNSYFDLTLTEPGGTLAGFTVEQYTATFNSGTTSIQDDTTAATTWLTAQLQANKEPRLNITYELPRMDLGYKVGDSLFENGVRLNASVFSIDYNLQSFVTTLTAVSR